MVAIREVTKKLLRNPGEGSINPLDFDRFLVLSVGTGSNRGEHKYNAKMMAKWGIFTWLFNTGSTPIIDCFSEAITDMVDYHNSVVFSALHSEDNYLRIEVSYLVIPRDFVTRLYTGYSLIFFEIHGSIRLTATIKSRTKSIIC